VDSLAVGGTMVGMSHTLPPAPDPVTSKRLSEINECGPNAIVSVMLDGRPDRTEDMVLVSACLLFQDGETVAECDVTDLELHRWRVDVRHLAAVRASR
jgi:hypothetical protein